MYVCMQTPQNHIITKQQVRVAYSLLLLHVFSAFQDWHYEFPGLFTDTSEHIRFHFFCFSSFFPLFSFWFRAVD